MTRAFNIISIVAAALCILFTVACKQERLPCLEPKNAALLVKTVHFKYDTSTRTVDTALPKAVFVPLTQDTTLKAFFYTPNSNFNIYMSSVSNTCSWLFTTDSLKYKFDTLVFYYQRKLQFVSNACGYTYYFNLDSIHSTKNIIDSLHITDYNVTNNVNTSHLQLYIHPNF